MADRTYTLDFTLANGGVCSVEFVAPQGEQGIQGERGNVVLYGGVTKDENGNNIISYLDYAPDGYSLKDHDLVIDHDTGAVYAITDIVFDEESSAVSYRVFGPVFNLRGPQGDTYTITEADYDSIATRVFNNHMEKAKDWVL